MSTAARTTVSAAPAIGPKKTLFVMVTVVGCIAILWPKVFYPMMMTPTPAKNLIKDHRGSGIRQERPPHLRQELVHPAMKERGRAISTPTVPITDKPHSPPPIIVEGRPGPIPGMRPPLGSAGGHQAQQKQSSMGLIMPLYTIGIVSFFIYTIMKLVFKKPANANNSPYEKVEPDPAFRNEVFTQNGSYFKRPDDGTTKLGQHHLNDHQHLLHHNHNHHHNHHLNEQQSSQQHHDHLMHENGDVLLTRNGHYYGSCGGGGDTVPDNLRLDHLPLSSLSPSAATAIRSPITTSTSTVTVTAAAAANANVNNTNNANNNNYINNDNNNNINNNVLSDDDKCKKLSNGKHVDFMLIDNNNVAKTMNANVNVIDATVIHSVAAAAAADKAITAADGAAANGGVTLTTANSNQLLELDLLRKKLEETERAMAKIISQMGTVPPKGQESTETNENEIEVAEKENGPKEGDKETPSSPAAVKEEPIAEETKKTELNSEREKGTVKVLGMEMTASCENGKKWSRPSTPVTASTPYVPIKEPVHQLEQEPVPQSIYLQGALPHESQILVSDAETLAEEIYDDEYDGSADDPAVVLSGKMTLSLINLDHIERDALTDTHNSHKKENGIKTNGHVTNVELEIIEDSTKVSKSNVNLDENEE